MLKFRNLALGALLAGTVAAPAPAAEPNRLYDVAFTGTVQHEWRATQPDAQKTTTYDLAATTTFEGTLGRVQLWPGGAIPESATTGDSVQRTTGTYAVVERFRPREPWEPPLPHPSVMRFDCDLAGESTTTSALVEEEIPAIDGTVPIRMRLGASLHPLGLMDGVLCPVDPPPWFDAKRPVGEDLLDTVLKLPVEVIGRGKTIELVRGPGSGACPGSEREGTTACAFAWEGEVTFTRVDGDPPPPPKPPTDEELLAPLVVPPAPAKPKPPVDDDIEDLLAPLTRSAEVSRDGRKLSVTARCAGGCRGTATVAPIGRGAHAAARRSARLPIRLAASPRAQTVTLTVPRRLRAALRRSGGASVRLALRADAGSARTVRRHVTAKLARR